MASYVIELDGIVKEAFTYTRTLTEASEYAIAQYAEANYGTSVRVRKATAREETEMMVHGSASLVGKPVA